LLVDGGTNSSVAYVSQTTPIPSTQHAIIYKTALAGSFLGHKATYLDAGSGAKTSIPVDAVRMISEIGTAVIVGGGIKSIEQIKDYHEAGASIVVIGNHIETHPEFLMEIKEYKLV
jgi:putative glycerol-1-phosphate prenyltransferase